MDNRQHHNEASHLQDVIKRLPGGGNKKESPKDRVMSRRQTYRASKGRTGQAHHTVRRTALENERGTMYWRATARPPWRVRQENRARNKRARAARKVNR